MLENRYPGTMAWMKLPRLNVPIPDPSDLTMRQIEKVQEDLRREFTQSTNALKELTDEKFAGLQNQLKERATRAEQIVASMTSERNNMILGVKEMANAQRIASESAIAKSETNFSTEINGLKDRFEPIAARIGRVENRETTIKESRAEGHMTVGSVMGIIGGAIGLLALIVNFYSLNIHQQSLASSLAINPTVGADTKRIDDLVARMNDLSDRLLRASPLPIAPSK